MYLVVLNCPNPPVYLNPSNAELNRSVVKVEIIQQKKICQERVVVQNEDTSSIENRRPPTGEPKAEATPAAAPAEIKLRLKQIKKVIISTELPHPIILFLKIYFKGYLSTKCLTQWIKTIH